MNILTGSPSLNLTRQWHVLVFVYTTLKITFLLDRSPAIAGPAMQMHKFNDGRHLAGLEQETLTEDLPQSAWTSGLREECLPCPSWSWGCIKGLVCYPREMRKPCYPLCKIIAVEYEPSIQVTAGSIKWAEWTMAVKHEYIVSPGNAATDAEL